MKLVPAFISFSQAPVAYILMLSLLLSAIAGYRYKRLSLKLLLHPFSILKEKQYYRLFSADLVHHDAVHLLLNELLVYTYCVNLEAFINGLGKHGNFDFLGIYLFSCLVGSVMTTVINRKDHGFTSAGASGSVMGCMFSYIVLKPKQVALYLPLFGAVSNLYFGLLCIVVIIVYQLKSKNDLINHEQHFFGALGGIIATLLFFPGLIR